MSSWRGGREYEKPCVCRGHQQVSNNRKGKRRHLEVSGVLGSDRPVVAHSPESRGKAESSVISITRGTQGTLGTRGGPEDQFGRGGSLHISVPCLVLCGTLLFCVVLIFLKKI